MSGLPPLRTTVRTVRTVIHEVELDEQAIESAVMRGLGLQPGTEFVWDISSQGLLQSLTVRYTSSVTEDQEETVL